MSRLSSRIKNLTLKTHVFFSRKDLLLIVNHWEAVLEKANVKPEDYEHCDRWTRKINDLHEKGINFDFKKEAIEIKKENIVVAYLTFLGWAKESYEKYPNGLWVSKKESKALEGQLQWARKKNLNYI